MSAAHRQRIRVQGDRAWARALKVAAFFSILVCGTMGYCLPVLCVLCCCCASLVVSGVAVGDKRSNKR
jgi:hypothetical protein